ncbi:MAG: 30S ribosomal protein S9, partial [Mycobacterium sp.]|nr:30S ribosomal protein S9 [Mycobacterium sp.]
MTETHEAALDAAPREPVIIDRPIQTVGRRKEAIVRVRLLPGTGEFKLNGRTLEDYFPNKVHQQLIKAPLVTV